MRTPDIFIYNGIDSVDTMLRASDWYYLIHNLLQATVWVMFKYTRLNTPSKKIYRMKKTEIFENI